MTTKEINAINSLTASDPFKRTWIDPKGQVAARSEAWGRNPMHNEEESVSGDRLVCSSDFLKDVLAKRHTDLLVLIILRRYDKGYGSQQSKYWHTTAVVRIDHSLNFEFYPGVVNELHEMTY